MARRRRGGGWGQFGADFLAEMGDAGVAFAQDQEEEERYQTQQANQMTQALAAQQLARKGTRAQGKELLKGVGEQYPYANMGGAEAMMAGSTLTPQERMTTFTEGLRPDMSDVQRQQLYESMNLHQMEGGEPWQTHAARTMAPDQYGPPIEGYAPGGPVEQAQNIFRGLGEETERMEARLREQKKQELLIAHDFSPGESKVVKDKDGKPVLIFYKQNPLTGMIEIKRAPDDEFTQYDPRNPTQLQELMAMGLFGDLAGRTPPPIEEGHTISGVTGTGEDAEGKTGPMDQGTVYRDVTQTPWGAATDAAAGAVGDAATAIWEGGIDLFTMDPESWGHEDWSNRSGRTAQDFEEANQHALGANPFQQAQADDEEIAQHLGHIQQRWDDLQRVAAEGDAGTAQLLMKDLMHYVTSPDVAHILTDAGKQRILSQLGHFPVQPPLPQGGVIGEGFGQKLSDAGYPWNPLDPKYKDAKLNVGGGTARRPFDLSQEQGTASSSVVPDIQGGKGYIPGVPQEDAFARRQRELQIPSSSQQLPPLEEGATVERRPGPALPLPSKGGYAAPRKPPLWRRGPLTEGAQVSPRTPPRPFDLKDQQGILPSTQVPNIQGGRPGPLPPLSRELDIQTPMTPRQPLPQTPTDPRGLPQRGPGGPPDIQGGLTPRQPFPPSGPEMTQRPQAGFDLNQMPGTPESQQLSQVRGGIGAGRWLGRPGHRKFFEQDNWALPTQVSKPSEEVFPKAGAGLLGIGTQAGAEKLEAQVKAYAMGNDNPFAQDMPQQTPEQRRAMWAMMRRWINTESKGESKVESGKAAHGVLQVIESKARADLIKDGIIREEDYPNWKTDSQENMQVAMLYLHLLASKPSGNYGWSTAHDALSAYHAGPTLYSAYRDAVNNEGHDPNVDFRLVVDGEHEGTYGSRSRNYANSILNALPPEMVDELDKYFKQAALGAGREFKNREGKAKEQ